MYVIICGIILCNPNADFADKLLISIKFVLIGYK